MTRYFRQTYIPKALYNEVEELARTRFEGIMARNNGFSMSVSYSILVKTWQHWLI